MTASFIDSGLKHGNFLNSDISQSNVVTQLRCGRIINNTLQWYAPFPLKTAPSYRGSGPQSNSGFLGPTRVLNTNGISIGSVDFARLTIVWQTDWPTDRPRYSVGNNRPHLYVRSTGDAV